MQLYFSYNGFIGQRTYFLTQVTWFNGIGQKESKLNETYNQRVEPIKKKKSISAKYVINLYIYIYINKYIYR